MNTSKLISQLGVVVALAALSACGGGSSGAPGGTSGTSGTGTTGNPAGGGGTDNSQTPNDSSSPQETTPDTFETELLTLINNARAEARNCGSTAMPAVAPLAWNDALAFAAESHSQYMKDTESFSHTGAGGTTVGDRVTAEGYDWQTVGENIAAGYPEASDVVDGWVNSAGHCENLMAADFTELGVSKIEGDASNFYSDYWTMVVAAPL